MAPTAVINEIIMYMLTSELIKTGVILHTFFGFRTANCAYKAIGRPDMIIIILTILIN